MVLNKCYLHLNTFQLHRITSALFFMRSAMLFKIPYSYFYTTQQLTFQLLSFPSISFILLLPQTLEFKSKRQHTKCVWIHTHTAQVGQDSMVSISAAELRSQTSGQRDCNLWQVPTNPLIICSCLEHAPVKTDSYCLLNKGRVKVVSVCILMLEFFIFAHFCAITSIL